MIKQDVINMTDCMIKGENDNYKKYMENNPDDKQREHDHAVIMSVFTWLLNDLNVWF